MPEVQLNRIEAGVDRDLGRSTELLDHRADLVAGDFAAVSHGRRVDESARSHRGDTGESFVGHHPGMTQLRRDCRAGRVHRACQPTQARQRGGAHHDLTGSACRVWRDAAVRHGGHADSPACERHVEVDQVIGHQAMR